MSIHDGHRKRLKQRYQQEGLDQFDKINALELLLFYCVPRSDTNPLAHALLERFETFDGVLDASPQDLVKVPGIGENVATFLSLIKSVWRYYDNSKASANLILTDLEQCGSYLQSKFRNRNLESVYLLCLDAKCKVLCCRMIAEGSVNSASVSVRKIVETAINANATTVVLAHNHPSGVAVPSADDVLTTRRVAKALQAVEVVLADHLVFADGDYVSVAQSGGYCVKDYINPSDLQ